MLVVDVVDEDCEICCVFCKGWGLFMLWLNVRKKDCIFLMEGRLIRRCWLGGVWWVFCLMVVLCLVGIVMVFVVVVVVVEILIVVEKWLLELVIVYNCVDGVIMERFFFSMNIVIVIVVCKSFKRLIFCWRY